MTILSKNLENIKNDLKKVPHVMLLTPKKEYRNLVCIHNEEDSFYYIFAESNSYICRFVATKDCHVITCYAISSDDYANGFRNYFVVSKDGLPKDVRYILNEYQNIIFNSKEIRIKRLFEK